MKKRVWAGLATGLLVMGMAGMAEATLTTIGQATYNSSNYNLIWDNNNNGNSVVWLDYSNSWTDWSSQNAWASGLNYGAGVSNYTLNAGYSVDWGANAWRLPTTVDGDFQYGTDGSTTVGYNITTSEMGHLFYTELGNKGYYDTAGNIQAGYGLTSVGDFANLTASWYWSGTEYAANPNEAWGFLPNDGYQDIITKDYGFLGGLAVRSGQVTYSDPSGGGGTAPVPEPATMVLLGTGLAGLAGGRLRKWRGRAA